MCGHTHPTLSLQLVSPSRGTSRGVAIKDRWETLREKKTQAATGFLLGFGTHIMKFSSFCVSHVLYIPQIYIKLNNSCLILGWFMVGISFYNWFLLIHLVMGTYLLINSQINLGFMFTGTNIPPPLDATKLIHKFECPLECYIQNHFAGDKMTLKDFK